MSSVVYMPPYPGVKVIAFPSEDFVVFDGIPVLPTKRMASRGNAAELRNTIDSYLKTIKVSQCFFVPDEKYARYASDRSKEISTEGYEALEGMDKASRDLLCRKVTFREIPGSGCRYGVWRIQ